MPMPYHRAADGTRGESGPDRVAGDLAHRARRTMARKDSCIAPRAHPCADVVVAVKGEPPFETAPVEQASRLLPMNASLNLLLSLSMASFAPE